MLRGKRHGGGPRRCSVSVEERSDARRGGKAGTAAETGEGGSASGSAASSPPARGGVASRSARGLPRLAREEERAAELTSGSAASTFEVARGR
jgi:hypothetical protein